jgi:hypothetical protein
MTLLEAFYWRGDFYHGTARRQLRFDTRPNSVSYFTPEIEVARDYALSDATIDAGTPHIIRAKLSVRNPAKLDEVEMQDLHADPARVAELQAQGHDCAIHEYEWEVAVFGDHSIHVEEIIRVQPSEAERKKYDLVEGLKGRI